jgi:asparagine synthase (glutamine-hydrolysing)
LLSQPIIEACLKIPTWIWYHGGINRAPVRAAFADDLPHDIVARTSKGGFSDLARRIYLENFEVIKSLLLDGMLCRHAIVDRHALEAAMAEAPAADDHRYVRILRLADVEAWVCARNAA